MDVKVGAGQFIVKKKIGAGSFGEIFLGENQQTKEPVAIKLEPIKSRSPQLFYESKLYTILASGICIPRSYWYGSESNYNVLVMELMGKSLEDLFNLCNKKFSLKTVLMIADQMLCCLEYLHNKNFIHRDIKPDNFLIGRGNERNQIFMIDFGLAKKFRDQKTHEHLKHLPGKSLTGTARYASINALSGYEQSRRDDLEALGYVWLYFLLGVLPWQGLQADGEKQKYERILEVKKSTDIDKLCAGLPEEFKIYLNSVRSLKFEEEPHYSKYREMFRDLFLRLGYTYDYQYDWSPLLKPDNSIVRSRKYSFKSESELPSGFPQRVRSTPNMKKVDKTPAPIPRSPSQKKNIEKKCAAPGWGTFGKRK